MQDALDLGGTAPRGVQEVEEGGGRGMAGMTSGWEREGNLSFCFQSNFPLPPTPVTLRLSQSPAVPRNAPRRRWDHAADTTRCKALWWRRGGGERRRGGGPVDDAAAHGVAVAGDELGGGLNHDVGAVLDWAAQVRRRQRVVHQQRHLPAPLPTSPFATSAPVPRLSCRVVAAGARCMWWRL